MTSHSPTKSIKHRLESIGVKPSKSKGQNFLSNPSIAQSIVDSANIYSDEIVVEVGPGLGVLTERLVAKGKDLFVIEIERTFCEQLPIWIEDLKGENVIFSDVTKVNLSDYISKQKCVIVSNVPYIISSQVILWIIKNRHNISRASLLFQKEFSERICASPGTKQYGSLTVLTSLYADCKKGLTVSGNNFHPPANVESQLVDIRLLDSLRYEVKDELFFEKVVRASFATRRKTLLNCLFAAGFLESKEQIVLHLESLAIDPKRRGETLALEEYVRLANSLWPSSKVKENCKE